MMNEKIEVEINRKSSKWSKSADVAISAALILGREQAREISKTYLNELFKLVGHDYDKALEVVFSISEFSVRRLLLEQFRRCFILNTISDEFEILLKKVNLHEEMLAVQYDFALMKLLNECDGDVLKLTNKLMNFPLSSKRVALNRLNHPDFQKRRKVQLSSRNTRFKTGISESENIVKWWHWLVLILAISLVFWNLENK